MFTKKEVAPGVSPFFEENKNHEVLGYVNQEKSSHSTACKYI